MLQKLKDGESIMRNGKLFEYSSERVEGTINSVYEKCEKLLINNYK